MAVIESTATISGTSATTVSRTVADPALIQRAVGFAVTGGATQASVLRARGFAVTSNGAGAITAKGYQIYSNPASAVKAAGYMNLWPGGTGSMHTAKGYAILAPFFPPVPEFNVDYDFVEERFPDCISFGSSGGPGFMTNVVDFDSGVVAVNQEWERVRASYQVSFDNATPAEISMVEDFFYIAKGRAIGFRFKDWNDYQIVNQNIAVGDGVTNAFQVFKRYQSGNTIYDRKITKLLKVTAAGQNIEVTVDGATQILDGDVFVNESRGIVSFNVPPPLGSIVRIVYAEFDVPVRFDTDSLDISFDEFRQLSLEIPLIEVQV